MHLQISYAKRRLFCPWGDELIKQKWVNAWLIFIWVFKENTNGQWICMCMWNSIYYLPSGICEPIRRQVACWRRLGERLASSQSPPTIGHGPKYRQIHLVCIMFIYALSVKLFFIKMINFWRYDLHETTPDRSKPYSCNISTNWQYHVFFS